MIEILPVHESEAAVTLEARERGQALGHIELLLKDGEVILQSLEADEDALLDALVRAALSYALSHGVDRALFDPACAENGVRLGFVSAVGEDAYRLLSVREFLTNSKKCKNW